MFWLDRQGMCKERGRSFPGQNLAVSRCPAVSSYSLLLLQLFFINHVYQFLSRRSFISTLEQVGSDSILLLLLLIYTGLYLVESLLTVCPDPTRQFSKRFRDLAFLQARIDGEFL